MPREPTPAVTRDELRLLATQLLEEMRALNDRIDLMRRRLFEERRVIRDEMRQSAHAKKPGRITVFHEKDGSTRVEHD